MLEGDRHYIPTVLPRCGATNYGCSPLPRREFGAGLGASAYAVINELKNYQDFSRVAMNIRLRQLRTQDTITLRMLEWHVFRTVNRYIKQL